MVDQQLFVYLGVYAVLLILIRITSLKFSDVVFPSINFVFCILLFTDFYINPQDQILSAVLFELLTNSKLLIFCLALVISYYSIQVISNKKKDYGIGYLSPILLLFIAKIESTMAILGASYLSFRLLYLRYEVSVKGLSLPRFSKYVEYSCFPLIYPVGPITPLSKFVEPLDWKDISDQSFSIFTRLLAGLIKVFFLSFIPLMAKTQLFPAQTESIQTIFELILYGSLYYLYVYINFSGACDLIISICHLAKIKVIENFDNPLAARNIQEFWMNWHRSLTNMIRELVFSPLYLILKRQFPKRKWLPLLSSTLILFLAVGLWHGFSLSFVLLGLYHAFGVSIFLIFKSSLSKKVLQYKDSWYFKNGSIAITQLFVAVSFIFFESQASEVYRLLSRLT